MLNWQYCNEPIKYVLQFQRDLLLHYGCEHNFCLTLYKLALERKAKESKAVNPSEDNLKRSDKSLAEDSAARKPVKLLAPLPKPVRLTEEVNRFHMKFMFG